MIKGLRIVRIIQSNERYDSYEAEYMGKKVFAKKAKTDKTHELLARVPQNTDIANKLGQKTDFKFRAPKVISQELEWLVTEWIEGQSLATGPESNLGKVADILIKFLLVLDAEPVLNGEVRKTFKSDSLADYMTEKLPKNLTAEQKKVIADAKRLFDKLQLELTPSWQDGDFKPEHIMADPNNKDRFVLIDPEHLDPRWPRFYSLANNITKYWIRQPKKFSDILLKEFLSKSGLSQTEIFKPLLACIIVRGISLHWETDYDPGAESYNIPRSQVMLKVCLKARTLDDLLY